MTALHARRGATRREVVWVVNATLPFLGPVLEAPPLTDLVDGGTLERVELTTDGVVTRAAADQQWRDIGARVGDAVEAAIARLEEWVPQPEAATSADEVLRQRAEAVLVGPVGDFIRSHGGTVSVSGARDDVVSVHLGGACRDCPALGFTLNARIERAIREVHPSLQRVRMADDGCPHP